MSERKSEPKSRGKRRRPERPERPERREEDSKALRREAEAQVRAHAASLRAHRLPVEAEPVFVFRP